MIKFLKKRKHTRTSRLRSSFNKPTIRIINNNADDVASADVAYASADVESADVESADVAGDGTGDVASDVASDGTGDVASDVAGDVDDIMSINMSKISSITNKFKVKKGDLKKSIMTNASLVKELLIKTVDKHKIDMCTQMASQLVEVYNKKHAISSPNEEI